FFFMCLRPPSSTLFPYTTLFRSVRDFGCHLVEVTGGEPLARREVFGLIRELCDLGYEVLIETGGFISIEDVDDRAQIILDVKCRSEEHTSELQSLAYLVCRLLLE